jgi:hypothetical protein
VRKVLTTLTTLLVGLGIAVFAIQTPANAYFFGCPDGTGCFYTLSYGGGSERTIAFSGYGANICHNLPTPFFGNVGTVASDYGSGYYLYVWDFGGCVQENTSWSVSSPSFIYFNPPSQYHIKSFMIKCCIANKQ